MASKPKQDDSGRIAARNRLAAIKNAMRQKIKQEEHFEATAPVMSKEVDKIVFDAGFFRVESPVKSFSVLSSERLSQSHGTPKSISKAIPESKANEDLLRQMISLEKPQSTKSERVDKKILFSNISGSRNNVVEDVQCPGLQDLVEINHDEYGINKKEEILDVAERMELNSSVISQDVLMTSPEKYIPSQNNISQEAAKPSELVLLDNKSVITECHLLDSPGLNFSNQVEKRHQEHVRHISFGGNLITFSPLRPLSGEQPEKS